ncbi:hypothetical protein [Brevundimonas vesicularis]|uniref:hypothetical protein n=1 Tax=Brevundimonas vesicularis TaxID=41276 RepID=UPI00196A5175|nr:hypothetical protein [Brevundimonas vesicularis]
MAVKPRSQFDSAMTGNAGLNYASWQLSRRGWHVMPTIRNARGSDLIVTDEDETTFFGVQSKALKNRSPVPLGKDTSELRSEWWIITTHANADQPVCFILRNDEVRALASTDKNGAGGRWLEPRDYDKDEFREAWHRLNATPTDHKAQRAPQPAKMKFRGRPKPHTMGGRAWAIFDSITEANGTWASVGEALERAAAEGLNLMNVRTEYGSWRRFHGIIGRIRRPTTS